MEIRTVGRRRGQTRERAQELPPLPAELEWFLGRGAEPADLLDDRMPLDKRIAYGLTDTARAPTRPSDRGEHVSGDRAPLFAVGLAAVIVALALTASVVTREVTGAMDDVRGLVTRAAAAEAATRTATNESAALRKRVDDMQRSIATLNDTVTQLQLELRQLAHSVGPNTAPASDQVGNGHPQ